MQYLIDAGLANRGLVRVDSPQLIDRYNQSLTAMGLQPTDRKSFSIDGIGFSPEIASDFGDQHYLSHGEANPLGIILMPQQQSLPIYFPTHSFDRDLLEAYFAANGSAIIDVTSSHAIALDFENHLNEYREPADVLSLSEIIVRATAGDLSSGRQEQMSLIHEFRRDGWLDQTVRHRLRVSGQRYGDLRERRTDLPDFLYKEFGHFYVSAFGGVFVLRNVHGEDLLILSQDGLEIPSIEGVRIIELSDYSSWVKRLATDRLIEVDFSWYRDNPDILNAKAAVLMAFSVNEADPSIDLMQMSEGQRKGKVHELSRAGKFPDLYHRFEHLAQSLRTGRMKGRDSELSDDLWNYLVRPARHLPESDQDLLWMLLCRLEPRNILMYYTHDKNGFIKTYQSWPVPLQKWAAQYLKERYIPRMDQTPHGR